jgi:hypothetical protein
VELLKLATYERLQGSKCASTVRVLALIAFGVLLLAGTYWWLRSSSDRRQGALPDTASSTSSYNKNNLRLGFAAGSPLSESDAASDGCSPGAVIVNDPTSPDMDKKLAARIQTAKERFQAALFQSTDKRQQAIGFLLQRSAMTNAVQTDNLAPLDALARLAADSSDPAVYEIALMTCMRSRAGAGATSCDSISAGNWSAIDPDNAVPWLTLANAAERSHDTASEAIDIHRAAAAQRFDNHASSLLALAQPAMPADLTLLDQYYLGSFVTGIQSAMPLPYGRLIHECSAQAGASSDELKDCGALAEHMLSSARTLFDFSLAIQLGDELGWPQQRLADLRQERSALTMMAMDGLAIS